MTNHNTDSSSHDNTAIMHNAEVKARNRTPEEKLTFVDATLAVAGHEITDPVMRDLLERVIRNEITADQAMAVARHYVQD